MTFNKIISSNSHYGNNIVVPSTPSANVVPSNNCSRSSTTTPSTPSVNVAALNNCSRSSTKTPSTPSATITMVQVLHVFNTVIEFFRELRTNYQGVKTKNFMFCKSFNANLMKFFERPMLVCNS